MAVTETLRPRGDARRQSRSLPIGAGLLFIAFGAFLIVMQDALIPIEAFLTSKVLALFTYGKTIAADAIMWIGLGSGEVHGLMITPLCSTIVLLAPIVLIAGGLMLFPRFELRNVVRGLLIAVPLAIVGNLIRYVLVAFALQVWGMPGFDIMHHYVGSVFVLLCTASAIVLLLVISARGRLTRRSRATGRHGQ